MRPQVTYLGHIISAQGVSPDPSKLQAVADYPPPTDAKQLKKFLGLSNYYRRFIQHYAAIPEPLHKILHGKPSSFQWNTDCQQAFATLKAHLVSTLDIGPT